MSVKTYMYFHAGSKNHGCEAIVRSTGAMLGIDMTLVSDHPEDDIAYGIDGIVTVTGRVEPKYTLKEKVFCVLYERATKREDYGYKLLAKYEGEGFAPNGVALSIGGDNYCYGKAYNLYLDAMNRRLHKRGLKTVLWGCSIEPEQVTKRMKRDFARYDLITARESISYEFLKKINKNTVLVSDPAFLLETEEAEPAYCDGREFVGINISPLAEKNETVPGIMIANCRRTIEYILNNTDYAVMLVPHVVSSSNDDRELLMLLMDEYSNSGRVVLINDANCCKLKGYISKCRLFIGARTHATIAAYSSCVPTIAIGYSTKALGFARDIFGTDENYVLPIKNLNDENDMKRAFCWLDENKASIHDHLCKIMPEYRRRAEKGADALKQLN